MITFTQSPSFCMKTLNASLTNLTELPPRQVTAAAT